MAMPKLGGFLLTGGGDPLTGEYKAIEHERLVAAGGRAVFLVDEALTQAVDAWREVYTKVLGARAVGVVVVRQRASAADRRVAHQLAQAPLVWLACGDPDRLLANLQGTPLAQALAAVVRGGGTVAAFGAASGLLGATASLPRNEGVAFAYGLGLVAGAVVFPGFERPSAFESLAEATAGQPDLVGIGLPRGAALWIGRRGEARVVQGRVLRVSASAARVSGASLKGLEVDLLPAGERFVVPVYHPGD